MQIAIDIPDKDVPNKQEIIDISLHFIDGNVCECSYPYIVLPKGHGDLVDRDTVYYVYDHSDEEYTMIKALQDAETIIEADKGESEIKNDN